jgi:hypothetical protein
MTDTDREREREEDELRQVADQVDPAQGFEVERPTPEQLESEDDGYVPGDHGVHLWQQPSEADVLAAEAELDAKRQADEPDEEPK